MVWGSKIVNESFVKQGLSFVYKYNTSLHATHYRCSKLFIVLIKLTAEAIVAHGILKRLIGCPQFVGKRYSSVYFIYRSCNSYCLSLH